MNKRFEDVFQINVPNRIIDPFAADPIEVKVERRENFIDLVADPELKVKFLKDGYLESKMDNLREMKKQRGRK